MNECRKCEQYGLHFQRGYAPEDFLEGEPCSKIWVIGLNPAVEPIPESSALAGYFADRSTMHPYFKDFAAVSRRVFDGFGRVNGTAHTDLVKCSSKGWPPPDVKGSGARAIVSNCENYLYQQIQRYRPALIICNGANVSTAIKKTLPPAPPVSHDATSYLGKVGDQTICVILSGFIGRIDNYAKRRLGREIEERLLELGL